MNPNPNRYFIINKPYKMVSQFVSPDKVNLLGDIDFDWPEGTHAIGRLDNNSEGLLILTTNKRVTKLLKLSPVQFSLSQNNDQIFMADYILDLSKPQVARAYDEVLSSVRNISKAKKLASPKITFFRKNVAKN